MASVRDFLYACDHSAFLELTEETWLNRWFPNQISLSTDVADVDTMSRQDQEFYKFLFTFLGMAERLVNFNIEELVGRFRRHDISHYYAEQVAMENIHGKVYANILNMLFKNNMGEVYAYAENIVADPTLQRKLQWLHGRVATAVTDAEKVLLFLIIEGIFFISSFYSIGLLRLRGIMHGVCLANDYISRDELLHTRAAVALYKSMIPPDQRPSTHWIHSLFQEAVDIECAFIEAKGQGVSLVVTSDIRKFVEATADRLLTALGVSRLFGSVPPPNCPLTFAGCVKSVNFFEHESADYTSAVENDL